MTNFYYYYYEFLNRSHLIMVGFSSIKRVSLAFQEHLLIISNAQSSYQFFKQRSMAIAAAAGIMYRSNRHQRAIVVEIPNENLEKIFPFFTFLRTCTRSQPLESKQHLIIITTATADTWIGP